MVDGLEGQPLPDPRLASSPSPSSVGAPRNSGQATWRRPGEWCVQVSKNSCQGSNTHPISCGHQGLRHRLWTRVAHSYLQYFKQLQGSHHPLPHPKVIQPAKGMLPESPVTLAGLPDATSNSQRDLCKSNSVFPSKPSQVPCPKQGEVHVLPRPYVTLRDLVQLSFGRLLPSLALFWEPGLGEGSHRELIRGADSPALCKRWSPCGPPAQPSGAWNSGLCQQRLPMWSAASETPGPEFSNMLPRKTTLPMCHQRIQLGNSVCHR